MKQNEKGFTLIELLAVIVILAVIALIATQIIINTVNESRKDAAEASAYGTIKAVQVAYMEALSSQTNIPDTVTFEFGEDSKITVKSGDTTLEYFNVTLAGNKPTGGTITIKDGNATTEGLIIGKFTCSGTNKIVCE